MRIRSTPSGARSRDVNGLGSGRAWLLLLVLALTFACAEKKAPPMRRDVVPISAAEAVSRDIPVQVSAIGTVEALSTVSVKSQVNGEVREVHFKEGQEVKAGDLLFTIDARPFETDLRRAEANLARDTAQLNQAEANLARDLAQAKNAQVERHRYQQLLEKGVAAPEQYDAARTTDEALAAAVNADKAGIENAREAIRADQAAIDNVKIQLGYCVIRSPIDGRTGSLLVHPGNLVKANDTTAMLVINQVSPIYVSFSVPEQHLRDIRTYMATQKLGVQAIIPGEDRRPVEGVLTFIDNAVDSNTGTIRLKGSFTNQDRRLWPGQFVNVVVTLASQLGAIIVPSEAVQTGQTGPFVFVVKPDMTVELRPITPGRVVGSVTVIDKGVRAGEKVVTDGQIRLMPGSAVQIKEAVQGK
jgi:multidrug efflux system membrane fusion protein